MASTIRRCAALDDDAEDDDAEEDEEEEVEEAEVEAEEAEAAASKCSNGSSRACACARPGARSSGAERLNCCGKSGNRHAPNADAEDEVEDKDEGCADMSEWDAAVDDDATHSGSRKMRTLLKSAAPLFSADESTAAESFSSASPVASCRSRHRDSNSSAPDE